MKTKLNKILIFTSRLVYLLGSITVVCTIDQEGFLSEVFIRYKLFDFYI